MGQHQRQPWFGCACCPSNVCRFIPSLPGYVYAVKDNDVYVNLFMSNTATLTVGGKRVVLTQQTNYPWNGNIALTVDRNAGREFTLKIRIPGWVKDEVVPSDLYAYADGQNLKYTVTVNGASVEGVADADGYLSLNRRWKKGDKVEMHFDMAPRVVKADNRVAADRGRMAVERGPLVYCAEWPDNDFDVLSIIMNRAPRFEEVAQPDLLYGLTQLRTTNVQTLSYDANGRLETKDVNLTLIPYYAWAHRGAGKMAVWLPCEVNATRPTSPVTLASSSKIDASTKTAAISAINDQLVPQDADDRSVPYFHYWPKQGGTEWITYSFPKKTKVSSSSVYWFDDAPWGGCRVPQSWKLYYRDEAGEWKPVSNPSGYSVKKGSANMVNFDAVETDALKLEVELPEKFSTGIYEWEVK